MFCVFFFMVSHIGDIVFNVLELEGHLQEGILVEGGVPRIDPLI